MTIEAKLLKLPVRKGSDWHYPVRFTDTVTGKTVVKYFEEAAPSDDSIKANMRNTANRYLSNQSPPTITIPLDTPIDLTPTVVTPPTPPTAAEIARDEWLADWRTLNKWQQVFAVLPATATQPRQDMMLALVAKLEADFLPAYAELI